MGTQLIIAYEVNYISEETFKHLENKIHKIQSMIANFMETIK